jgi:hypothetical protein
MKKQISVLLSIILLLSFFANARAAEVEYELWTESPYVTSGITYNDLNITRGLSNGELDLYPLTELGTNYYLAVAEEKMTDGGYSGKTKTSYLYCYLILVNNRDFLILSEQSLGEEYYWDRGFAIQNIRDKMTNLSWYSAQGSEVPYYVLEPQGLYTNTNYTEYYEYLIITSGGKLYRFSQNADYGTEANPTAYNGLLYSTTYRYKSGSSYPYYYVDSSKAARLQPYIFQAGSVSNGDYFDVKTSDMTTANGYISYKGSFGSNVTQAAASSILNGTSNTFPDGRSVTVDWISMGNYVYQVWYYIKNADGTSRAQGPTGYATAFSSSFDRYDMRAIAVNNSKFVMFVNEVGHSFVKEYYRVAVVQETISGEVQTGGSIGSKNITPPNTTDTEPVQSTIDFAENDLPLGYNIKDNVIDSGKLDSILRQQVNAIRLNDVLVLKKPGYISGSQNTGIALSSYNSYDYSFGSTYIRFYTSGQYLYWYCYYPENLTAGTYNKAFAIGDKTVYVTVRIIAPPTNNGSSTVVF